MEETEEEQIPQPAPPKKIGPPPSPSTDIEEEVDVTGDEKEKEERKKKIDTHPNLTEALKIKRNNLQADQKKVMDMSDLEGIMEQFYDFKSKSQHSVLSIMKYTFKEVNAGHKVDITEDQINIIRKAGKC